MEHMTICGVGVEIDPHTIKRYENRIRRGMYSGVYPINTSYSVRDWALLAIEWDLTTEIIKRRIRPHDVNHLLSNRIGRTDYTRTI